MFFEDKDFESVATTAIVTAYPRTLTDIPYEKEIFAALRQNVDLKDIPLNEKLAIEIEARYKLINKLLEKEGAQQVLELAAGYSSKGLNFALRHKTYVEMDLASVTTKKQHILQSIISRIPDELHVVAGNALNWSSYEQCKPFLDKNKKLGIINEGLLRYLTFDEKKIVAENIHSLLSEFPGVWITGDITPKAYLKSQNQNMPNFNKSLATVTSRNNLNDRFEDKEHIIDFFSKIGFEAEFHARSEIKDELSSPKILNYASEEVDALLANGLVAVFKIKKA